MNIELSIITVNYNGLEDTCALIDTITFNDNMEVIVVDNGSNNNEASIIQHRYPLVKTIRSEQNLGFAGGNNLGIKAAHGKFLFFLNNDTLLKHQASDIRHLANRIESDSTIGMVCPKIRFAWEEQPIQFAGYTVLSYITLRNRAIGYGETDQGQYDTPHPTPYAHGAAMLTTREAVERVGQLPECYFLYYEEIDWSIMFRRAGYEIWYEPACTIFHKESRSTGTDSPLKTYYITRNRFLFAKRNVKKPLKYATYCYLIFIVGLRDACLYIKRRRPDLFKAMLRGWRDFYMMKFDN